MTDDARADWQPGDPLYPEQVPDNRCPHCLANWGWNVDVDDCPECGKPDERRAWKRRRRQVFG